MPEGALWCAPLRLGRRYPILDPIYCSRQQLPAAPSPPAGERRLDGSSESRSGAAQYIDGTAKRCWVCVDLGIAPLCRFDPKALDFVIIERFQAAQQPFRQPRSSTRIKLERLRFEFISVQERYSIPSMVGNQSRQPEPSSKRITPGPASRAAMTSPIEPLCLGRMAEGAETKGTGGGNREGNRPICSGSVDRDEVAAHPAPPVLSGSGLLIGEDLSNCVAGLGDDDRVGIEIIGQRDQRDRQCPAATARPCRIIGP